MIKYNVEMKSFIRRFSVLFLVAIIMCSGVTLINLRIIKEKVVENNQAIIGNILSKRPELEEDIIDIVTQGNSKDNVDFGQKY
ncbi:hypothetical protein L0P85_12725 [Terrisporobacter glycolicus]|nr:hypothetical protein L0P85_12725 [Terrisporobacter glycolicus]